MKTQDTEAVVAKLLDAFYVRRIAKLSGLKLRDALKRKNPYLFRAIGTHSATEIVEGLLKAYMSSSDEGIFGDAFFEPLAKAVSNGTVAPSEGVDIVIETKKTYKAVAVKSGPSVFNAQSRRRQNQDFLALRSRMAKLQKQFDPIVGYCYGNKRTKPSGSVSFRELAGQSFWEELTGDSEFYLKIIDAMRERPAKHRQEFIAEWNKAINRFTRDFIAEYCLKDGTIDWHKFTKMNCGKPD
ncbi:MAG TPA: cytoplasmic protein [Lentisphaeria bacterium]|nr:MAG: cytoplasmic protein [Lentisphaerae bacterium GWF2_49_21]HBC86544.1 cytoplasmic protein [Lentisphaeria bacterium]